ncbi:ATP-binding cassette domain-containing protein [uncultured Microbacterium sp.]|uniref:ATP-binding cassette domain-containing protein n=1 Tax=uncultured Microbacterium sp. TaxID=191216 RepID=UPI002623B06D|nr:ATP-binding cassette domain-containing protein [uncultured Microbacterium sp.]
MGGLIRVGDLRKTYPVRNAWGRKIGSLDAVDGVTLEIAAGETLGVVGESGSGKSTLGRLILGVERPTAGAVEHTGSGEMQIIHQDPFSALNPHRSALASVMEPLTARGASAASAEAAAREALAAVGIDEDAVRKRPRAFSGGQRQRIAIARAIAPRPAFIVCDEPVSALDMSIQAQVTDLLKDLQREFDLTYLFISHDLSVVREIATRTAVMRRGRIVELAPTAELFAAPRHPYTRRLLDAVLLPDPVRARERLAQVAARPAAAEALPDGPLVEVSPDHFVAG